MKNTILYNLYVIVEGQKHLIAFGPYSHIKIQYILLKTKGFKELRKTKLAHISKDVKIDCIIEKQEKLQGEL